jgi:DNA-directed RNA polymerase subunit RPC12/RpoP
MISHMLGVADGLAVTRTIPSRDPEAQLLAIQSRLDALELACAGLWELLKAKTTLTDEDIVAYIRQVDMRDGTLDGRASSEDLNCPNCGRRLLAHSRHKCLWCGAEFPAPATAASPRPPREKVALL